MKNTIKLLSVLFVVILVAVTSLIVQVKHIQSNNAVKEKSDQAKAEELVEKMKPKIEERLHKRDIHNFIKTITFEKDVTINPMGDITIDGYVNDEPEKYGFSASLQYRAKKIGSMSYDPELSDRFIDWEEYKDEPEVKENYLKSFTKEERDQYLRDIGEKD
ncbi:DUF1433 domain-containing protein [Bacillus sp. CNPSo 3703]|uniref:DUF1433 domain-containing protein n=1 Tax=Bacillus altitudinis TaxID=293387 RepID=UPI00237A72A8|nr:DUF1433 domain-containing protein [Bacillus altitudinis]MDE0639805.1 DUF1433 domain-containing protein [Bacillus altitudinis]